MTNSDVNLLLLILIGAYFMPFLSRKLFLPSAVGELIYGLALGYALRNHQIHTPVVEILGELGFIVLMYLAGLEINFEKIKATSTKDLLLYLAMAVQVAIFAFFVTQQFNQPPVYALIYLTTAIGLLFPVLKEAGLMGAESGQALLIMGSIGEVVSLLGLTGFIAYFQYGFTLKLVSHISQIGIFLVIAYLINKALRLFIWWFPEVINAFLETGGSVETGVRANLLNAFVFVALASMVEMELIVGAFLGGMLFALIFKEREQIQEKIGAFGYGFLIPIFFIEVGLRFEVTDFMKLDVLSNALLISVTMLVVRILACPVLLFSQLSFREIALTPLALAFPLTLLVALATFGMKSGALDRTQASSVLLAAILTALVYPTLFKLLAKRWNLAAPIKQ